MRIREYAPSPRAGYLGLPRTRRGCKPQPFDRAVGSRDPSLCDCLPQPLVNWRTPARLGLTPWNSSKSLPTAAFDEVCCVSVQPGGLVRTRFVGLPPGSCGACEWVRTGAQESVSGRSCSGNACTSNPGPLLAHVPERWQAQLQMCPTKLALAAENSPTIIYAAAACRIDHDLCCRSMSNRQRCRCPGRARRWQKPRTEDFIRNDSPRPPLRSVLGAARAPHKVSSFV
jgi:hypothetical protein